MGAAMGRETDAVAFFAELADATHRYDFYQTLRRIECLYATKPRWGEALRPSEEPVRLGQDPDLSFAPAPLASFEALAGETPRLQVRLFGLLGPNGPLPLHITEYVRERLRNANDPTLSRFLDMLHHRFLALFYRAWAQAQPHVGHDRPDRDNFAGYIAALIGIMPATFRHRDTVPDIAKLFHASALVRHVRNAEGLAVILRHFFRVPTRVEEFVGHWMRLGTREQTALARDSANLGAGAVLGRRVWDCQHKFRIHAGPLTLIEYESFLPARPNPRGEDDRHAGTLLRQLVDWVRLYVSFEFDWDARLTLAMDEIPPLTLGVRGRLGWTTWLSHSNRVTDASDLYLRAETLIETEHRVGVSA
jgi:type VI secretion system protein ImpH